MKRKSLFAKSLALGLAVATAVASMSPPGSLLNPEVVYAAPVAEQPVTFQVMDQRLWSQYGWENQPANVSDCGEYTVTQTKVSDTAYTVNVSGTAEYVTGFTGFNTNTPEEQEGYYFPFQFALGTTNEEVASANMRVSLKSINGNDGDYKTFRGTELLPILGEVGDESLFSSIYKLNPSASESEKKTIVIVDLDGDGGSSDAVTYTIDYSAVAYDTTAPTLDKINAPIGDKLTATSAAISIKSSETGKAYYVVKAEADENLTAAGIKGDSNKVEVGGLEKDTAKEIEITKLTDGKNTALTANTPYYVYVVAEDAAGNPSDVQKVTFTTLRATLTGDVTFKTSDDQFFTEMKIGDVIKAVYSEGIAPGEMIYAWYRVPDEGEPVLITDATSQTYTLTAADVGYKIMVEVSHSDYLNTKGTTTGIKVEKKDCDEAKKPTFGADAYNSTNKTLTATVADKTSAADYAYSLDGGKTWVKGNDAGSKLTVTGTSAVLELGNVAYKSGDIQICVAETTDTEAGDPVPYDQAISATLEGTVTITGTPKFGQTLTASAIGIQSGATLKYQWIRVNDSSEENIGTASETNTYTLKETDIGKKIKVKVTADGYGDVGIVSTLTAEVAPGDARSVAAITETHEQNGTAYKYTLNKQEPSSGAKYACVEGSFDNYDAVTEGAVSWSDSNVFNPLDPNKEYTFFATYDQEDTKYAKSEIKVLKVKTPKLQRPKLDLNYAVADAADNGKTVTITAVDDAEYCFDGTSWGTTNEKTFTASDLATTSKASIGIRYKEDAKYEPVTPLTQEIDLSKETPAAPTFSEPTFSPNTERTKYKLQITAPTITSGELEYSLDGNNFNTTEDAIEAKEYDANESETVYVRIKATTDANASNAAKWTVKAPEASKAPTIVGDDTVEFETSLQVQITAPGSDAIYFTTDGTDPTIDSMQYADPIPVAATIEIRAIAVETGKIKSKTVSKTFTKKSTEDPGSCGGNTGGGGTGGGSTGGGSTGGGSTSTTPSTDKPTESKPVTETKPDGTKVTTTETKEPDGTEVKTVETKAPDGSAETKVELKNDTTGVEATVNVEKNATGEVTEASADVTQIVSGKTAKISAEVVSQIAEAAGTKDVLISQKVVNEDGKTVCKVTVNAADLTAGNKMAVLKINKKTGKLTLINKSTYTVAQDGSIVMNNLKTANYMLVTKAEADAMAKQVLKTVKVTNTKKNVTAGKKTKISLSKKLDMDNVAKITYTTSKKSVATVNKNGTIKAKKAGKVTVKAKVTLKNGKTKTVKMTVTVKKSK